MKKPQHHPNFVQVIYTLRPLLREYRPLAVMQLEDLCDWMSWYWNRGTMAYRISDSGKPQGVCLIRLFKRLEQFMDRDVHQPCGQFCFIELSVAEDGRIMWLMLEDLENRWGPQEVMMWDRGELTENGTPRMYRWPQFKKLARRLSLWDHHLNPK
jgi:hypothetical protein